MKITENMLLNTLSHGSGINCDWIIEEKKDHFICANSFHCMHESGMYDGYADFFLKVHKKLKNNRIEFDVHFTRSGQYLARKYDLRPYLEDTFANDFDFYMKKLRKER